VTSCDDKRIPIWDTTDGRVATTIAVPRDIHRIVAVTAGQIIVQDRSHLVALRPYAKQL
jgi:hypothetical protein